MSVSSLTAPAWDGEEFLELAEASSGIGVWHVDLATGTVRGRPQFFRLMGLDPNTEQTSIAVMRALRHPEDREAVVEGFRRALEQGRDYYESEYRIVRPDGEVRWILGRGRIIRNSRNEPTRYSGVDIDITDRKQMEARQALLTRELQHRAKNLLAVIQSVTLNTIRSSQDLESAQVAVSGRIRALARAQDFVVNGPGAGISVDQIAHAAMAMHGTQVTIEGPSVIAGAAFAQNFALVIHELATNATKYGALSTPEGRVRIRWSIDDGFSFSWIERGGPSAHPPVSSGFGSKLIKTVLGGNPRISYSDEGLEYEIVLPIADVRGE
jgi:PAS domain S-box-containing protein